MVARRPIESRKLLLENTFAIKEEFSNNEATSWAVRELKRQGLKRLFKPVTSTAYERLVREFYENLRCECDQPDVLFSSIDGREVEVTIADVAAILKCSHEPPEMDIPWLECPPMLTVEDIVTDMCDGQFADGHRNAASKTKIPRNLLFIDIVLLGTCVLWGTRHKGGIYSSVLCMRSIGVSGAPFPRSYGGRFRNSGMECTIGERSTRRPGACLSLFSPLIF
jgi:hypothetical protein